MNIAEYSIRKKTITWFLVLLLSLGGIAAYTGLGKLEDPSFTIKTAVVSTAYTGASPVEVEQEVTEVIESAIQQLGQVDKVRSLSQEGASVIYVDIKDTFTGKDLPQIWDELRRKVGDVQRMLPPGAGPSLVNDDYGDVFGVYFALTGKGYTPRELEDFAIRLRKELLLVPGVANVRIAGAQREAVYVELSRTRMAQLGISLQEIFDTLKAQNVVASAGKVKAGTDYIRIDPTGTFSSPKQIESLLLLGSSGNMIRLGDIATVTRGYVDPSRALMRFNGEPAIGIGISNVRGGNVITMGDAVRQRLRELEPETPVGMRLGLIYYQSDTVRDAINNFIVNLLESLVIVIGLLLVFMGLRSGMLIGAVLLLTILATFVVMRMVHIDLHSISLGALIVALGMLVDNAIVVADGILVRSQMGQDRASAAIEVVKQTQWPLMGATLIAIIAFAPIGLSPDSTGEFCGSLFQVVGISLLLSWVLAVTVTPLAGILVLKPAASEQGVDPYGSRLYRMYRAFLEGCLRGRVIVVWVVVGVLVLSVVGFGLVDKSFFPNSTSPMFTIDFWRAKGTHIETTAEDVHSVERFLLSRPETASVASYTGEGALRFILTYTPGDSESGYGSLVVTAKGTVEAEKLMRDVADFVTKEMPHIDPRVRAFSKGTGGGAKIQARFRGEDPMVLRDLEARTTEIMRGFSESMNIKCDWGLRVKVIRPQLDETRLRSSGLTRRDVATALELSFSGSSVGLYREDDKLIPIVARLPLLDRGNAGTMPDVQVWSQLMRRYIPLVQVTSGLPVLAEDPTIYRRNRMRTITIECDASDGRTGVLFGKIRPKIEGIPLPPGYSLEWGGEYESSQKAQSGLMGMIPLSFVFIVLILVMLFNAFGQVSIILLTLPLSLTGMTAGLLVFGKSFDFMALLGFLSLAGMLIKNAIVLIDQIDLEVREGKTPYDAIVDSAISRARPVLMAAMTTVLGMIPLYFDTLFSAMAVTIMFGLTFATALTLVVVPVLYAIFFKVTKPARG
jgi:multidrug efflux pump subunit AcrB